MHFGSTFLMTFVLAQKMIYLSLDQMVGEILSSICQSYSCYTLHYRRPILSTITQHARYRLYVIFR